MTRISIFNNARSKNWYFVIRGDAVEKPVQRSTGLPKSKYTREEAYLRVIKHLGLDDELPVEDEFTVSWLRSHTLARLTREHSPEKSIEQYNHCFDWLEDIVGPDMDIRMLKRGIVSEVKKYAAEKELRRSPNKKPYKVGCAAATVNSTLAYLSAAFNYLVKDELIERNPFAGFERVQSRKSEKPVHLTLEEMHRLLDYLNGWKHKYAPRLLRIYMYTGLRRGELLLLERGDIVFYGGEQKEGAAAGKIHALNIKSKDKHHDWLPVNPKIKDDLQYFLDRFPGKKQPFNVCVPTTMSIWAKRAIKAIGLSEQHLHSLRHSFATLAIESGMSVREVQHLLRHSNLSTTLIYSHDKVDLLKTPDIGL